MRRPVLLLHGALGSSTQLKPLQQALEKEGFVSYTLDFSGHSGKPYRSEFGIEAFGVDVYEFLNSNGIPIADIFGYSMGGYVSLWFAVHHPQRVGKIITLGTKFDWSVASAEKEIRKMDPQKVREKAPAFARLLEQRHNPNDWEELMKKTSDMMKRLGVNPLLTDTLLRTVSQETLIMLGDSDDMADRSFSMHCAQYLSAGKFLLLPNTPHPIEKVHLKTLVTEVLSFLTS